MRHLLFDMYHTFYLTNAAHCVIVISIHIVHYSTGRGTFPSGCRCGVGKRRR